MHALSPTTKDFLITGEEYLARKPGFRLVGRDRELKKLTGILMRRSGHNVLLVGAGGVGCSAICLGLQELKNSEDAPLDIVGKRVFWLDTDGLFSSGDHAVINEGFRKLMRLLARTSARDTLLILEDARVFIDAAKISGCTHFINAIMKAVKAGEFQIILEARDEDLELVLKTHADIGEAFTMMDVQEPDEAALSEIVTAVCLDLEKHHGISIAGDAIRTAIELTGKYRVRDMSLSRAQPERALNLIDRALASYRQSAHTCLPAVRKKRAALAGLSGQPLEALQAEIATLEQEWQANRQKLREYSDKQRRGEQLLRELEEALDLQQKEEAERDLKVNANDGNGEPAYIGLGQRARGAGFGSQEVMRLRSRIEEAEAAINGNRDAFDKLTREINADLNLSQDEVLSEFSILSGIPADKLNQDERIKLLALEDTLKSRVFGQDAVLEQLAGAVRVARAGLKEPNKPQSAFLYAGPSGVGKTETAKALTAALMDDERALLRFDMSEYMEKHAVAKLIGAPPGYEGYEAGGILTNAMRRNPHVNVLFDEVEKAHPDVFNVLLQVLDDGRLTDNRGLTVSFSEANIIMTTNIGQTALLDTNLSFEEARNETFLEMDKFFRPEFLNRFNGRQNIVCFNRLELPVIEQIAKREIKKINERINAQGRNLVVAMDDATVSALCKDQYEPARGARGVPGYFTATIYPAVARTILSQEDAKGVMTVTYDTKERKVHVTGPEPQTDV